MDEKNEKLSTPVAIIFAGILIAGAVLYGDRLTNYKSPSNDQNKKVDENQVLALQATLNKLNPISETDHVRGDLTKAKLVIVEYSDTECPFCKQFHQTLKKIVAEYGDRVAWVYRHFPIDNLHSKARQEATALECANELGGVAKFWEYTDRIYEITPSNNGLDLAELPKIAKQIGLDEAKFNTCLASDKYKDLIEKSIKNAVETNGGGTPWSIVIAGQNKYPINGAQPYEAVKQIIETALKQN